MIIKTAVLRGFYRNNVCDFLLDIGLNPCYNQDVMKEVNKMGTEAERQDTRKAMAFDLFAIIDQDPSKETYTKEEMKKLIFVYVTTADQK